MRSAYCFCGAYLMLIVISAFLCPESVVYGLAGMSLQPVPRWLETYLK